MSGILNNDQVKDWIFGFGATDDCDSVNKIGSGIYTNTAPIDILAQSQLWSFIVLWNMLFMT
jgi:hypothetical protein